MDDEGRSRGAPRTRAFFEGVGRLPTVPGRTVGEADGGYGHGRPAAEQASPKEQGVEAEACAEKLARYRRTALGRDVYDLAQFAGRPSTSDNRAKRAIGRAD